MSLHCDQLLEMLLNKEINDLVDDCFEGSSNEHCIFTKVFFGGDTVGTSKRCVVTGVINFECDSSKNTDISLGYNSDSSALLSQSSSKNLHTETCNVSEAFRRSLLVEKSDHEASLKRMKFSVDEPSNTKPNARTVLNHSLPSEEPVCRTTSFHLLELPFNGGGVKSSNYLLKHDVEMARGAAANLDALKCTLPSIVGKDVPITKTIASPVSQESFTNRLLATSPSATVGEKSGFLLDSERPKEFDFPNFDESSVPMKQDSLKDARSFLHYHVVNLLTAAGWSVEKRKRPSRSYNESVYITPQQKLIRDFPKAWRLCGQNLFANGHALASMPENDCKEWSDFSKFSSDLLYTLTTIEKQTNQLELSAALVLRWCLLDPFVTVVCINRKVGALKKGELVKVSGSLNLDAVSVPKIEDSIDNQFAERRLALIGNSSLAAAETSSKRAVKLLKGVSICTANKEGTCFFGTSSGMENLYGGVSRNGTTNPYLTSPSTYGLASASCLYDVPISSEKRNSVAVGVSSSVSLCQDGNTDFPSCVQHGAPVETPKHVVEDASMDSWEEKDESSEGRQATDKVENCRTDGWFYSHGSDKTYIQLDSRVHSTFKLCRPSLSRYSILTKLDDDPRGNLNFSNSLDEPISPEFVTSEVVQQSGLSENEDGQCTEPMADVISKRKIKRKSRKISEIKLTTFYQSNNLGATSPNKAEMLDSYVHEESKEIRDDLVTKSLSQRSSQHSVEKKGSGVKKIHCHRGGSTSGRKRCQIKDDDLLVSAIIKNKDFGSNTTKSSFKPKASRSRALRKLKSQKGGCRLLPRSFKGGMNFKDGKWLSREVRTVLSWLIDTGVVALNDGIVYRNPKDEAVVKEGLVSRDGIICKCCDMLLSVSEFKIHAGFKLNRPCLNLFMESGKPFTMCLLQAWSAEYKTRKSGPQIVRGDDDDQNDDSCGLCGDGGELICCDNCPSTFHQDCLSAQELPEGSWYCLNCTCRICGDLVNDKEASSSTDALKCSQCEHKYHESCLKEKNMHGVVFDSWFCSGSCQEIYSGLHSRVGLANCIADGFSWTLLRCIHDDQKVHSAQRFALKAECNSKLAVALTIMEECFLSMVDPRTGINMIPQVLYNWGSEFARLNFQGFYSAVLEKDDVLISVASIRVHGMSVAEMPLIATCSKYRRQGMCRRLMAVIEEMLISFKVDKLVISAIPNLVDTWIKGFGFVPVEQAEKESFNNINLMVFPGTILLKKSLYSNQNAEKQGFVEAPPLLAAQDIPKDEESVGGEAVEVLDVDISASEMVCSNVVETLNVCDDEKELCLDEQKMK